MNLIPTWPIAAGALVVGLVTGATGAKLWYAGTVADLKVDIANMQKDNAEAISQASQVALSDYKTGADLIKSAALGAQTDLTAINAQLAAIRKGQKMHRLHLFPLIASLALCGCATSPKLPPQPIKPSLDQYLANDCQLIGETPTTDDYDVLQGWVQDVLIPKYIDCAVRHHQTVVAWPK